MSKKQGLMLSEYKQATHRIGRIWTLFAMLLIVAVPLGFGLIYGVMPEWSSFFKGVIAVVPMYWAVGLIEIFNYSPMLGSGGTYLAFVTGNLLNMKVPAAKVAMDKAGVSAETEEGEVLSTIAVAVSSIVTTIVLIIALLFVVPITNWINNSELLREVFDLGSGYVIPALFGALGVVFLAKSWKIAVIPMILMIVVFLLIPATYAIAGILIPVMSVISVLIARFLFNKEKI
ncbi:MAG: hypothetical protein HN389_04180 [Clostridia bacterium]|jgi:hypothetical protein|nr:hypothetical protein [Clostridia bacterium]